MDPHTEWLRAIDAELEDELTLVERAALARHLAGCTHCAGARASHLEMRVAMASAAGQPQATRVTRPTIRGRTVALLGTLAALAGAAAGWGLHARWGGPGGGVLEDARATIVVQ
jgi:anti-sigma factor RsiW